jgi:hypothetical protein
VKRVVAEEPALRTIEVVARTKGDGVADREERDGAGTEVHEVLHHDVGHALGPGETRFDQRETRLHEDHKHRGDEYEHVVEVRLYRLGRECVGLSPSW